jgi:radical SAM superfamily enzyme YgiQ (UPF0313 family)
MCRPYRRLEAATPLSRKRLRNLAGFGCCQRRRFAKGLFPRTPIHVEGAMSFILFVQLPPPRFSFVEPVTNIPLAAGFLASALAAAQIPGLSADILESEVVDVMGDAGLLKAIVARKPSILALTLYVWNVDRSLFLAANVKRMLPETKILVGGPEVTPDNGWLIGHPAVDAGVFGEGESRIRAAVQALLADGAGAPAGSFFRRPTEAAVDLEVPLPWDLSACRYPYLDSRLAPARDGTIFLETVRGCPFRCAYCYYHKAFARVKFHPSTAIEEVLDFAYSPDSPVREIYLMDPTFNAHKGFRSLLQSIARRRGTKDVALHTELRADLLNSDDVRLFLDAGLVSAEIGLQSVNPAALRRAARTGRPDKVSRGVGLLKDAGIEVTTGIILGLPDDTPNGFRDTLDWLKQTQAYSVVHPFVLSVLPGTDFRRSAQELGLKYEPRPPYYVRSTLTFPEHEFRPAMLECERVFDMEMDYIAPPVMVDSGPDVTHWDQAQYVSKWIVNLDRPDWANALASVAAKATDPFSLWLRGAFDENAILHILDKVASINPHTCLHVILELNGIPQIAFLDKALQIAAFPGHYLNRSYWPLYEDGDIISMNFWIILADPHDTRKRRRVMDQYVSTAGIIWDTDDRLFPEADLPLLLSQTAWELGERAEGFLRDLQATYAERPEEVLFRDPSLQYQWNLMTRNWTANVAFTEGIVST